MKTTGLLTIGIVHHFDMVNHLDTVICGPKARVHIHQPPCSQDCVKLGGGLGMRLHTHLICGRLLHR